MIYSNIMLDLETMSQQPDAAIVAIGAIAIDLAAGQLGPAYYERISLESSMALGGSVDASTIRWWMEQSDDARSEVTREDGQVHLQVALQSFASWLGTIAEPDVHVWGCGADFDNVILASAYRRAAMPLPWHWWRNRCYRTIKAQRREVPFERLGTHHNAMSDATSQAMHLIKILNPDAGQEHCIKGLDCTINTGYCAGCCS